MKISSPFSDSAFFFFFFFFFQVIPVGEVLVEEVEVAAGVRDIINDLT